ncbi:hypothetical+protein [Methylocapsa aurea]|jgi:hypothetical protein
MGHLWLERYGSRIPAARKPIGPPLVFAVDRPTPVDWSKTEFRECEAKIVPAAAGSSSPVI